jgi:hypothetical protein
MTILSRAMVVSAIKKMQHFHEKMVQLYSTFDIDLLENSGRRNIVMSVTQEKFFADEIKKIFPQTAVDGGTGKADIMIPEINRELECKLSSGSGKYSAFDLQTDWSTLERKKSLDYLFVLATKDFNKFVVLFFDQLTTDDFFPPSPGSRGKSRMNKENAMKKCNVLFGDVLTRNSVELEKLDKKIAIVNYNKSQRLAGINTRLTKTSKTAPKKRIFLKDLAVRESLRFENKLNGLLDKQSYWKESKPKYRFQFESICIEDGAACFNSRQ